MKYLFKKIKSKIGKYFAFTKGSILNLFAYKFSVYMWLIGTAIQIVLYCFLWSAIFKASGGDVYNGYTLTELLSYTIYSNITIQLVWVSSTFWDVSIDIREGNISTWLTRPISYRIRNLAQTMGYLLGYLVLVFIPIFIVAALITHFGFGLPLIPISNILLFAMMCFLATILIDSLDFLFAQVAFFTGALFGLGEIKNGIVSFLSGAIIPLAFFPEWARTILGFLPYSTFVNIPVQILLGKVELQAIFMAIGLQLIWIIALVFINRLAFRGAVKHVVAYGG